MKAIKKQLLMKTSRQDRHPHPIEEITLLDIFQILERQWKLILGIVIAFTFVAIIIALCLPTVYRCESVILPPKASDIEQLNLSDLHEITVDSFYLKIIRNLQSSGLRHQFFVENRLVDQLKPEMDEGGRTMLYFRNNLMR